MAAISLAKSAVNAFNKEKPHSSITDWVEILTSPSYTDESYDGIPDLIEAINIQSTGPAEASRALRKKIKHGDTHRQYRALVTWANGSRKPQILKALVENCGTKFQTTFADGQMTDALRHMQSDSNVDPRVRKKLQAILAHWHRQFKGDSSMSAVVNLYKPSRDREQSSKVLAAAWDVDVDAMEKKRAAEKAEKEAKKRAKAEKEGERLRKIEEERKAKTKTKRKPFDFEKEKPAVIQSIATASQAASNLVNALTLVNTEMDSVQVNARVQECLANAKQVRKQIVRYIQLVENEELIGTLIESNERIIAALEMYDKLSKPDISEQDVQEVALEMQAAKIGDSSEVGRLQEKQRAAVERSVRGKARQAPEGIHPDLQDLGFGTVDGEFSNLPPPIRPSAPGGSTDEDHRGSLSDYSDYSSDEESHQRNVASGSSARRPSGNGQYEDSDDDEVDLRRDPRKGLLDNSDDPFADPFADEGEGDVSTPGIATKQGMNW